MTVTIKDFPPSAREDAPLFIDAAAVRRYTPMTPLVEALHNAFVDDLRSPERQGYELPDNATLLLMPAWRRGAHCGVKIITVQPDTRPTIQSTYFFMEARTGRLKAVMDGTMLTPRRTAAASALVCRHLARADASTLLMIGTGALAPHLIEAHVAVRPIRRVMIWGRDPIKARRIAHDLQGSDIAIEIVTDLNLAVPQADIISAATSSRRPLIRGALLKPGTHVDLVGAFRPDMAEADSVAIGRSRIFVDGYDAAKEEAGDLLQAIAAGQIGWDDICGDLHALCSGRVEGRTSDNEITLFKSVGVAMEDLVAAELIFESCAAEGFAHCSGFSLAMS